MFCYLSLISWGDYTQLPHLQAEGFIEEITLWLNIVIKHSDTSIDMHSQNICCQRALYPVS